MKQQVNFYTEEFKPKKELLSLENIIIVWFIGVILVLALYNLEAKKNDLAKQTWQTTQQREQHQRNQFQTLQSSFADKGDAIVLEKTLTDLESNLSQRNYVLEQLGLRADGMKKGVAGLMENLAQINIQDLWLTEIKVIEGQLSVSGITKDSEQVPKLIQELQSIQSLQDKRFSRLEMKADSEQKGLMVFSLQSENQQALMTPVKRRSK